MKKRLRILTVIGISIANTMVMFWITFFLLSLPYIYGDELLLLRATSVTKNLLLGWEEKPDSSRFLFVDVAWEKELIDKFDENAPEFPIGQEAITNRQSLAAFLDTLSQKPTYKMIILDVNFMGKAASDSLLLVAIKKLPNLIISYHRDEKDSLVYPDLAIPKEKLGLSDIEKTDDVVIKFNLFHNDSIKSTPLLMYEKIYKKQFQKSSFAGISYLGEQPIFTSFILDYRLRAFDYTYTKKYAKTYLGELLFAPKDFLQTLTKNRIIFIGDFDLNNNNDIHETIYGNTQGPLILLNAFLAVEAGDNQVTWALIGFLFVCFFSISFTTFYTVELYGRWIQHLLNWFSKKKNEDISLVASLTSFLTIFIIISVFAYFLFGIQIGILALAVYMNLMDKLNKRVKGFWTKGDSQ
ncbi:MAG: CHASE2 domain-containing protein [Cytophagales bacterium]|nr:MAG: CHASE2 domain-containing protein [Cytophagales bacterium]